MARLDQPLLAQVLGGDAHAIRLFVQLLIPVFHREAALGLYHCRHQGRAVHQEIEDLVSEIFTALWARGGHELRAWDPGGGRSLENYLRQFARFQISSILRTKSRNPFTLSPTEPSALENEAGGVSGHENLVADREFLAALLERISQELDATDVLVFRALLVEDRPMAEVSAELGLSEMALHKRKSRLRARLRDLRAQIQAGPRDDVVGDPSESAASPRKDT